jgi:hypothetical protein
MTTTLRQVLTAFEQTDQPLSLAQLAQQVGASPEMVDGMIQHWVRKGKLRENVDNTSCDAASRTCSCGTGQSGCPFIMLMPRSYELVSEDD